MLALICSASLRQKTQEASQPAWQKTLLSRADPYAQKSQMHSTALGNPAKGAGFPLFAQLQQQQA
jgi:hypothetical protein